MARQTITAVFDRYEDAAKAVSKLEGAGIPHDDISLVSNDAGQRGRYTTAPSSTPAHDATGTGTGTGASLGTVLGGGAGLLAGLGLLAIPGLGPVVAAGWLASTLVGAGAGAATGGIVGALTGAGVDESHAHGYAEAVGRGSTLVTVRTDEARAATVTDILDDDGTVDMGEREASWRGEGWTGRYAGTDTAAADAALLGSPGALTGDPLPPTGSGTGAAAGTGTPGRVRSYPL